jgi:hypothetical protein
MDSLPATTSGVESFQCLPIPLACPCTGSCACLTSAPSWMIKPSYKLNPADAGTICNAGGASSSSSSSSSGSPSGLVSCTEAPSGAATLRWTTFPCSDAGAVQDAYCLVGNEYCDTDQNYFAETPQTECASFPGNCTQAPSCACAQSAQPTCAYGCTKITSCTDADGGVVYVKSTSG